MEEWEGWIATAGLFLSHSCVERTILTLDRRLGIRNGNVYIAIHQNDEAEEWYLSIVTSFSREQGGAGLIGLLGTGHGGVMQDLEAMGFAQETGRLYQRRIRTGETLLVARSPIDCWKSVQEVFARYGGRHIQTARRLDGENQEGQQLVQAA